VTRSCDPVLLGRAGGNVDKRAWGVRGERCGKSARLSCNDTPGVASTAPRPVEGAAVEVAAAEKECAGIVMSRGGEITTPASGWSRFGSSRPLCDFGHPGSLAASRALRPHRRYSKANVHLNVAMAGEYSDGRPDVCWAFICRPLPKARGG
jgi:hypothetical protein